MKQILAFLLTLSAVVAEDSHHWPTIPRVYSVFTDRVPVTGGNRVVVQTHLFLSIVDPEAKQSAFIAYHVKRRDFDTENVLSRNFHTPAHLRDILLEQSDYVGSGMDIGHAYALASTSASPFASEVNSFEALFAQTPDLNRGPWLKLEKRIRELARDNDVAVMAGQLWLNDMPPLPTADEPHAVASHNWIWFRTSGIDEAYLFDQRKVKRADDPENYRVTAEELQKAVADVWWVSGEEDVE